LYGELVGEVKHRSLGVVILGSTGSVGVNTLKVIEQYPGRFRVVGLAARANEVDLLAQVRRWRPMASALFTRDGIEGLCRLATLPQADIVVNAMSGTAGLLPTYEAVKCQKRIALANKETLVAAGELIMAEAKKRDVTIIPVDSEHSAIFQCLQGASVKDVRRLIVTGSGGPFRGRRTLSGVTPAQALKHPTWRMGKKITVDSATLMNKGLEVIEAHHLFGLEVSRIEVVIHPQSIVHSLVEFVDGAVLAQLSVTDMRLPIQYALSHPHRWGGLIPSLDLPALEHLSFEKPDRKRFPCLDLAYEAAVMGGTMPAVLNAANEEAVGGFLKGRLPFVKIPTVIEKVMRAHRSRPATLAGVLEADRWAREEALRRMSC